MRGRSQIGVGMENELFEAKLQKPSNIFDDLKRVSFKKGVYGWWFDKYLKNVPRDGCKTRENLCLFYVGIAPRSQDSASTLIKRMKFHLLKNDIRSSTLRRSLAALLKDELGLNFWIDGKQPKMSKANEEVLSDWMHCHAMITISECEKPWIMEGEILQSGPMLPLNLQKNKTRNPFYPKLMALRKAQGRD